MKRLLAFLLLIAAGIVALKVAIGDEQAVQASGDQRPNKPKKPDGPPGVRLQGGKIDAQLTQHGALELPRWREIDLGDGRVRREEVYVLFAEDSQPIGEGVQQLTGVQLKLYDDGKHSATVAAREAFLELGRDASGKPTIDEQKEIQLRGTLVTTEPDSRMAGMRLELGDARVIVGDTDVQLTTDPKQPVSLTIAGKKPATLTGNGAQARLPRGGRNSGGLQRTDIIILSDPHLHAQGVDVTATGRMRYVEDMVSGAAQITVDDNVELDLGDALRLPIASGYRSTQPSEGSDSSPATRDAKPSVIRGDQFTGWLLRTPRERRKKPAAPEKLAAPATPAADEPAIQWQRLMLVGAPAVVDVPGVRVETPRITVRPGPLGDPAIITAHGGPSRIEQTELRAGSSQEHPVVGSAPRRIHLIRPGEIAGSIHRRFGFPAWSLRSLQQQQLVVFEGAAQLDSGTRELHASNGMVVVRRDERTTGVVHGLGTVTVRERGLVGRDGKPQPELVASGSNGMLLVVGDDEERLRLGPVLNERRRDWREHRYDVRYGTSRVRGLGACSVVHRGEHTSLELRAPFDEIEADFGAEGTRLRNVRQLLATLDGEKLTDLDVGGLPVRADLIDGDQVIQAQSPRLRQIGEHSLRLLPMTVDESPWTELAELDQTPRIKRSWQEAGRNGKPLEYSIEVFGPRIDVHHVGGQSAIIDAHSVGDEPTRIYARLPLEGSGTVAAPDSSSIDREPTTVACSAGRLRVLPFLLTPLAERMHLAGARSGALGVAFHSLRKPWLVVDDVREFALDDDENGHIEGSAERLFLTQGGGAALFVGNASEQTTATVTRTFGARTVTMRGARVRLLSGEEVRLSALGTFDDRSVFLPPTMTLHERNSGGLLSHMQAVCRGNIDVDPDAVHFGGPVEAFGIRPNGQPDPAGLHIDARELTMQRGGKAGAIERVRGKDVVIDWTKLDVSAADVMLDLRRFECIANDPQGATVRMPTGRVVRSTRVAANYRTWAISLGPGSATDAGGTGKQRSSVPDGRK
ncbi:MAG: hypothetical protein AB8H80_04270 [Planctomycetota bacterium]